MLLIFAQVWQIVNNVNKKTIILTNSLGFGMFIGYAETLLI